MPPAMATSTWAPLAGAFLGLAFVAVGWYVSRRLLRRAGDRAAALLDEARHDAEGKANELLVAAQEKVLAIEEEATRREQEIDAREVALESRSRQLESDLSSVDRQRKDLDRRIQTVSRNEERTREAQAAALADHAEARRTLERIAGLTAEEAREELVASIEEEARRQAARTARRIEDEAREKAERSALQLVVQAAQRVSIPDVVESTVTFIHLPSDEMKGRIIGREGRNIRALEQCTGIDLIVDETPRAILIASFDPVRREVARVAIARLIEDGRIHPARIEEVVGKVRTEFETLAEEAGAQAAFNLGAAEVHPRLARLVGRMKFRFHHGHNLLQHCEEVGLLAAHMAAELGARAEIVRRAGLLHEIGRVDDAVTGHPLLASADLASKYGESEAVSVAIRSLHPDHDAASVEALLLRIANRISDNRPGARKDNLAIFLERLRRLEALALGFAGVTQAFAVKAGKELRVLVDATDVSDDRAAVLSKEIAKLIEKEVEYPGQIRVSVIRETRAVQYAV